MMPHFSKTVKRFGWIASMWVITGGVVLAGGGLEETISVRIETRTGGSLRGLVVDADDHGLVIVSEKTPYVFAWRELTGGSAYQTKKQLVVMKKGGQSKLSGLDHFALGRFAVAMGRTDIAANEFRAATARKPSLRGRVDQAWKDYNASLRRSNRRWDTSGRDGALPHHEKKKKDNAKTKKGRDAKLSAIPSDDVRAKVYESYLTFGEKVRETLGDDIELLETEHFLIWTDWRKPDRGELAALCEAMYRSVCRQFDLDPSDSVFLSKCPIFCFRRKGRFQKFAQKFDGYSGKDSVGYTRSIEKSGHVHVAIVSQGDSPLDRDRFAGTLVHEGTHAVMHRLYSSKLIPHWVNEGYAELVAQRVLGERCVAGGNARLLARQYVRYGWPIGNLLSSTDAIAVDQYPTAHSVVAYMVGEDPGKFRVFIASLKAGEDLPAALARAYDGLTLAGLERRWREWVRSNDVELDRENRGAGRPRLGGETADNQDVRKTGGK